MSARRAKSFRVEIVRDGAAETPVLTIENQTARWQDTPDQCSVEGCGWDATLEFRRRR